MGRKKEKSNPEKKKEPLSLRISEALEIPADAVGNNFRIEMAGSREITLENINGLLEYSEETVSVAAKGSILTVRGEKLTLKAMDVDGLFIRGKILGVDITEV